SPATLRGRILDADGQPVPGAKLGLSRAALVPMPIEPWNLLSNVPEKPPTTDDEGRFELRNLHRGSQVAVYVNKPGYAGVLSERLTIDKSGEILLPDLRLRKATRRLSGQILTSTGQPIVGARVFVHDFARPETTTDAAGRFQLQAVPDGNVLVVATA